MSDIPRLELTYADMVRLRVGDIRKVEASDGTPVLVVAEHSPNRQNITWKYRVVVTSGELSLIETDPTAGQIVTVEDQPGLLFHLVGGRFGDT